VFDTQGATALRSGNLPVPEKGFHLLVKFVLKNAFWLRAEAFI
jgi:hypothetical protein